jgi:membrane-bound serine protease (ClpP class)
VYIAEIEGIIDLGLAPYVKRVVQEAEQSGAEAVILNINTFGGRVDAAVQIRDTLLASKIPTVAFINKRAISAGALISLSAGKIAMSSGATIGAAAPVQAGQPGAESSPASEKTVSYVRKEFRATAEARNRPLKLAEAMVDSDVEVSGVIEKGKLLTLTTEEAITLKLADFRAETIEDLLKALKLEGAQLVRLSVNWGEQAVRFLTHPMVSSLLVTIAMVGILVELRTPGFGIPGIAGVTSLGLFLWGHWIVQLVGWEELLVMAVGLSLLAAELLFIPGFGLAGILGITALLASLVMSMLGEGAAPTMILSAIGQVGIALLASVIILMLFLRALPRFSIGRALVLQTELSTRKGFASAPESDNFWLGKSGIAATPLHPAGIAELEGHRVDVVSEGEPIDAGERILVTRVDGNRVVVRRHDI